MLGAGGCAELPSPILGWIEQLVEEIMEESLRSLREEIAFFRASLEVRGRLET